MYVTTNIEGERDPTGSPLHPDPLQKTVSGTLFDAALSHWPSGLTKGRPPLTRGDQTPSNARRWEMRPAVEPSSASVEALASATMGPSLLASSLPSSTPH